MALKRCKSCIALAVAVCVFSLGVRAQSPRFSFDNEVRSQARNGSVPDKPSEKVRAEVGKMIAEAKAGRTGAPRAPQFPPPQSNSLSKTAKIAIVAGIVIVVVVIIAVKSFKYDCKSRCVL